MYTKFNYKPQDIFFEQEIMPCLRCGQSLYENDKKQVQRRLDQFFSEDGIIDASKLKEHWFSIFPKDIFISHSHDDIDAATAFAGWLYKNFGLQAFIDSYAWGYCDELLRKLDDEFCYKPKTHTYDYNLRNYTTSHVHMMLSTALTEMIYNTECIIFFNTPQSINIAEEVGKAHEDDTTQKTISPWIYHELSMTTMLKVMEPVRSHAVLEHVDFAEGITRKPKLSYDVDKAVKEMTLLTDAHLEAWQNQHCHSSKSNLPGTEKRVTRHSLDTLYEIVFPKNI